MTTTPHDPALERALLGSALLDGETLGDLPWFESRMFHQLSHRHIWDAMTELRTEGQAIDYLTVRSRLEHMGKLEDAGGGDFLARLLTDTPTSLHAETYAAKVAHDYRRRQAIAHATAVAQAAYADDPQLEALLASGGTLTAAQRQGPRPIADLASEAWDYAADPDRLARRMVSTGLLAWDKSLGGGLERATLNIVMARPGMGKTAVLCQVADFVSEYLGPVLFLTKEMNARQILFRIACQRARVSGLALRQGQVADHDRQRVLGEIEKLAGRGTLWLDDSAPQTTLEAEAVAARLHRAAPLALIVADHLRLFSDRDEREHKRLGTITWNLKVMARRLDVPVLAAAQLSRSVEGQGEKRPDLPHLRDSGEIEENADNVTGLYRERYYDEQADHTAELCNRKAREGERNSTAHFMFNAPCMRFEPLTVRP